MESAKRLSPRRLSTSLTTRITTTLISTDWGRTSKAEWTNFFGAIAMITCFPALCCIYWISLEHFGGSLVAALTDLAAQDFWYVWVLYYLPRPSWDALVLYASWLALQIFLYFVMPGLQCQGQRTPGGNLLAYPCNGLNVYVFTHVLAVGLVSVGFLDPAMIAENWEGLLVVWNFYGMVLSLFCQVKGYFMPTHVEDVKFTGSLVFDFLAGVELNPSICGLDLKWFHNTRPGIIAWTLIDLSWAAYQHKTFGYITKSMIIATLLHAIYVIDLFYNESWYTRTIDISHDHFGWYLAWGDTFFLPAFYTLQTQYLARYPTHLSNLEAGAILAIGLIAYYIFRSSNLQRDHVRQNRGAALIWGKPASWIPVTYVTVDGKEHDSILLTSGWWGLARHSNYAADMLLSWAMCMTCGFHNVLPWSYFFFMVCLLSHRLVRDDRRCRLKYGEKWDEYRAKVPYHLIPYIY